jgi:nitrogen regulatory protein P-II 2
MTAMRLSPVKLVTIVGEALLAERLIADAMTCGARGYAISDARGGGMLDRGYRDLGPQDVRIEVLVTPEVAEKLLARLASTWFPHYALIAWVSDAQVVRPEQFGSTGG